MVNFTQRLLELSDSDLDFLIETAAPSGTDRFGLKCILREDEVLRTSFVRDEQVIKRIMEDELALVRVSPKLYFEILLRKASVDLKQMSYTFEKSSTMKIPVFDSHELASLLEEDVILLYLADMLASFTKVNSYTIVFRVRQGMWRKIRFNDLDIDSLINLCEMAEEEYQLGLYKRIADICLFILGIFPEHAEHDYRYPFSGHLRPQLRGKLRIGQDEYEQQGRKFYKMAAAHRGAKDLELSETFQVFHDNFLKAKKPLNFIADRYLHYNKHQFFG